MDHFETGAMDICFIFLSNTVGFVVPRTNARWFADLWTEGKKLLSEITRNKESSLQGGQARKGPRRRAPYVVIK